MPRELNMTEDSCNNKDISIKYRWYFIIIIFLLIILIKKPVNNDIWFLLNSGRYVLENGIPYIEPFTIHQGMEFVMQQWLSACVFWVTFASFGFTGLNMLIIICNLIMIFFFYKLCMRVSGNYFYISFIVSLFFNIIIQIFMTQRPFIFSNLLLVIELYLLESYRFTNNKRFLYFLPIISLLLINLHAAMWPMMFVMIIPYVIDSFCLKIKTLSNNGYPKKNLFFILIAMAVAGLLNPYGNRSMTYLYNSYGYKEISNYVTEMFPPNINTVSGMLIYGIIFVIFLLYFLYKNGTTKLRYVLLTIGTAFMTLSSQRNLSFFVISSFFPMAYYFKNYIPPAKQEETKKVLMLRKLLIALLISALILSMFKLGKTDNQIYQEYDSLQDTIQFIIEKEDKSKVILYTGYEDGGMAEFEGLHTYIDARAEVFVKKNNKKEDIMKEYYLLQNGAIYYKDILDKYQFSHLIVNRKDILFTYLKQDKDYTITYANEKYTLFEKNDH
jgi:hypothetical protein